MAYPELTEEGDFNRRDAKCLAQLQQREAIVYPIPYTLSTGKLYGKPSPSEVEQMLHKPKEI